MSLIKYKKKRTFSATSEPIGGKSRNKALHFVVQKHDASRLHYDFRLEMGGVLKSWAVPKGPSTDPDIKRLAMMVEDHPYDYRNFEGVIPEGNYGAGTVMVWDEGTYGASEVTGSKQTHEQNLLKQLKDGKIKFVLNGSKLRGEFVLIRSSQGQKDNAWLLKKIKDEFASKEDVTLLEKSARSEKTIEQIASASTRPPKKKANEGKPRKPKVSSVKKKVQPNLNKVLETLPDGKFPNTISPMFTTLVDKPFDQEGWLYEVKWDGYRAVAFRHDETVELRSRNDKSFNQKFYPVYDAIKAWDIDGVVDGEIVVVGDEGRSNFGALQNWRSEADGELLYYIFDLLWLNGKSLMNLPLLKRKDILQTIVPDSGIIRISETFDTSGTEFFSIAQDMGLEGIVAKRSDSIYQPGRRTPDWLKIKTHKRQEVVIGGFTRNADTSKLFSALLVGVYDHDKLVYTGKIGTGFNDKMQREMMTQFKPRIAQRPPFNEVPDVNKPSRFRPNPAHATATWLKPELVCEVSFTEMTSDGLMRHPSFEGMRVDKQAQDVSLEKEIRTKDVMEVKVGKKKVIAPADKKDKKTLLNPSEETQVKTINGHTLKFTNLSKIFWPKERITKRDLINYYYQVAPYILHYLKDRPQSLNRHPNGIEGDSFYQKDVTGKVPAWIKTYLYHSEGDNRDKHFMVATDEASLLYMASLGCIELNPWSSTIQTPDNPDWCIIDIDPDKNPFNQVVETARVTHDLLESVEVPNYCKTSGATGLHVYIPLGARYTYEQSKEFARLVATRIQKEIPKFTSIERVVKERNGKIYIDFLQNRPQATLACPYSVRPKPGATVSMPLHWEEVKKGLSQSDFTIFNTLDRLKSEGDLFKPVLGKGINLEKVLKRLAISNF